MSTVNSKTDKAEHSKQYQIVSSPIKIQQMHQSFTNQIEEQNGSADNELTPTFVV